MRRTPRRSRGLTVFEIIAAFGLVAALMVATSQLVAFVGHKRLASWRREAALREASNAIDRWLAAPWSELSGERPEPALPDELIDFLPNGKLTTEAADEPTGEKRLRVDVQWDNDAGGPVGSVRLVAWRSPPTESPPRRPEASP